MKDIHGDVEGMTQDLLCSLVESYWTLLQPVLANDRLRTSATMDREREREKEREREREREGGREGEREGGRERGRERERERERGEREGREREREKGGLGLQ